MTEHEQIRHLLADGQNSPDAAIVGELVDSLSKGKEFPVNRLLELSYSNMHRSLALIEDWHLQRHRYRDLHEYLNEFSGALRGWRGLSADADQTAEAGSRN